MTLDAQACYRAARARDARFDGRFFTCVKTTGIYCRPICPAPSAKFENVVFLPSAAAAHAARFRPCLRCRPELSPDVAAWRGTQNTVARAMAMIAEGALDDGNVELLAERVGVGERQLRRLFDKHLGAAPVAVAQTRRLLFAKQLVQETGLPMTQVALAAGFGSTRRFNAVFQSLYGKPPSQLRNGSSSPKSSVVTLRLGYRAPYDWDSMLAFRAHRVIPGVELVEGDAYSRTIATAAGAGSLTVQPGKGTLVATIRVPSVAALPALVARLRLAFDLDADVQTIGEHLSRDAKLRSLVTKRPGLRLPGGWDAFEQSVRAVLGQQVTVLAARKLAEVLVDIAGTEIDPAISGHEGLRRVFPSPQHVLAADLAPLKMPGARKAAIMLLATVSATDPELLAGRGSLDDAVTRLRSLKGFGEWTAQYIALRAMAFADAFPAGDVGLQRGVERLGLLRMRERDLLAHAEQWRPWRAYAAQHLWTADGDSLPVTKETAHG